MSNKTSSLLTLVFASLFLVSLGMISQSAFADTVIAKTSIGAGFPSLNAVNPNTNMIYVAVQGTPYEFAPPSYWIYAINGSTNVVVSHIQFASMPKGIAVNPTTDKIFVTDGQNVSVIDSGTNAISNTVSLPGAPAIAVNPNTDTVYALIPSNNTVAVIDGTTYAVTANIPVGTNPEALAVIPNTNKIYVANSGTCVPSPPAGCQVQGYSLSVINGSTNTVTDTLPLDVGLMAVNQNTNKIYAQDGYYSLYVIDGSTDTYTTIPIAASCIGVNPSTGKVYACEENDSLEIINGTTNSVSCSLTGFVGPVDVAANPNTNKVYVSDYGRQAEYVIDGSTNTCNSPMVPSAPQNLAATGGNSKVTLSWSAPSSNPVYPTTSYNIYRSTSSGAETYIDFTGNTTSYTDTAVTSGLTYYYKVAAVNSLGASPQSNEATAIPIGLSQPPAGLAAAAASSSQINLIWTAPSNNGGAAITGYEIERAMGDLSFNGFVNSTNTTFFSQGNMTSFEDTGLASGTTYNYTVFAKNSVGTSQPSNTASAATFTVPSQPTALAATAVSPVSINLSWSAPSSNGGSAITGYKIMASTDSSNFTTLVSDTNNAGTTISVSGLHPHTTYYFKVFAINSVGTGASSNVAFASTR